MYVNCVLEYLADLWYIFGEVGLIYGESNWLKWAVPMLKLCYSCAVIVLWLDECGVVVIFLLHHIGGILKV